jgi:hypothetical protein
MWSPPRRGGVATEERRADARSPPRRGGVSAEERRACGGGMSGRAAASGTKMRVEDGEGGRRRGRAHRRREIAPHACRGGATHRRGVARRVGEERRGASEKRGASGKGAVRRGGGEDGRVKEERRDLGETVKCSGRLI